MKRVGILGSTGSIGVNALHVLRKFKDRFKVVFLTAHSNIDLLLEQIKEFQPESVVVTDRKSADKLKNEIPSYCKLLDGENPLVELTREYDFDILLTSIVGFAGLAPTIEAIKKGKRIALANKETLVVAGEIILNLCKKYNSEIIPVDSEHSAIFQSLVGEENKNISRIILTASGGPFLNHSSEKLKDVTLSEALNHPNWSMGNKITIDSATMMNKGLEVIEAKWLFNLPNEKLEVVVHPQSVIHSMVEFVDRSIKAQLSIPDMKLPIQYALTYPDRYESSFVDNNLFEITTLNFYKPDFVKFPALKLAYEVMEKGGTAPCVLNAANEIAVSKFLREEIKFTDITGQISKALDKIELIENPNLETIFEIDRQTREFVNKL